MNEDKLGNKDNDKNIGTHNIIQTLRYIVIIKVRVYCMNCFYLVVYNFDRSSISHR